MRFHIKTDSKANMFSYTRNHRRVHHISLVFCGMWDTTELPSSLLRSPQLRRGCPMFAPAYVDRKRRGRSPIKALSFFSHSQVDHTFRKHLSRKGTASAVP
jgi:hypothetical protein